MQRANRRCSSAGRWCAGPSRQPVPFAVAAISGCLVGEFEGVLAKLSVTDAGQLHWGLELQGISVGSGAGVP